MASSPSSTASSSDLYAASEPAEDYVPNRFMEGEPQADQVAVSAHRILSPTANSSPEVRTIPEERDKYTLRSLNTTEFSENPAIARYKRKWEGDPETSYIRAGSRSPGENPQEYHLPHDGQQNSRIDTIPSSKTTLGVKRTKTNGYSAGEFRPTNSQVRADTLPAELWHHVFRFVPPVFLGRLLRVNHAFHSYLTFNYEGSKPAEGSSHKGVRPLDAETIWAASRKRFAAGLPKPLRGLYELDMWRLLRGRTCQLCGIVKPPGAMPGTENPWEAGPGKQNVRVIWSFGIRCCGPCLEKSSEKEVDLLLSTECPSFLLPALPFAFVSSSMNYIPSTLLRESTAPPSIQIVKRFYKPHVQQIKQKFDKVKELGPASADEWSKGLAEEGKERISDAVRWEQWEAKGGLKKVNARHQAKAIVPSINTATMQDVPKPYKDVDLDSSVSQRGSYTPRYDGPASNVHKISANAQHYLQKPPPPYHVPWINTGPFNEPSLHRFPAPVPAPRPERSIKDVNEAKAARRAEIERRCSLFDPPLLPHILNHMESFQAAIQISTPLTEAAWDVLRPRLLNQRASAEKREQEQVQQNELLQSEFKQRRYQEPQTKESKETNDRHWDSVQAPVRDRLGVLADMAIDERWLGGRAVTKDSSPKFAADVLLYVRQRFYDEIAHAKEAATISGQPVRSDSPHGPPTQTLTLENMKWLFDTKIKPFTEPFQRELFLCNGCDDNFKFYGFEGVIQHYAAKHTSSLSMGSIVVYWRAEWPEEPPFNPEPNLSKSAYYKVPSPAAAGLNVWSSIEQQLSDPASRYGTTFEADPKPTVGGTSAHIDAPYLGNQALPYPDTSYPPSYHQGYSSAPLPWYSNGSMYGSPNGQLPQWQGNNTVPGSTQGAEGQDMGSQYPGYTDTSSFNPHVTAPGMVYGTRTNLRAGAPRPPHFDPSRNNAAQLTEGYQQQMEEMAKQARDVWHSTSNIRDLPASVRIYVVIHHVAARFSAKFSTVPSLAMFLDGIDNNAQMRPVRSLNGLACKICVTQNNRSFALNLHSQPPATDRRLYTLPHLLNHFRTAHLDGPQAFANPNSGPDGPKHDWTCDMIELPERSLIADLVHSAGMDDNKLELIAWAFPHVFPSPLPRLGILRSTSLVSNHGGASFVHSQDEYVQSHTHQTPITMSAARRDKTDDLPYNQSQSAFRPMSRLSRPSEPPGEDEYDPHKPAYQSNLDTSTTSIDGTQAHTSYPPDPVREKFEWYEPPHERQLPETTDLSKLIYSATQMHPLRERPEHRADQQQQHPTSSTFLQPQRNEDASINGLHDDKRMADDDRYQNDQPTDYCSPEDSGARSLRNNAHSSSASAGIRAAERFLQHLGQTSDNRPQSYEQHYQRSPVKPWPEGSRVDIEVARQYSTKPADHLGYRVAQATHEMSPQNSARAYRPISRNARNVSPLHVQSSEVHSQANHQHASSSTLIHDDSSGTNGRGSHTYSEHPTYGTIVEDRHPRNGYSIERPDSSRDVLRFTQATHFRDRPRSSAPVVLDPSYYRSKSPTEELQPQSVYRIRSPLFRQESHEQRTFYEYPRQDRYELVEEHGYAPNTQNRYAQRIEYVPVRMGNQGSPDSGRYIIDQPSDQRGRADYVRLEDMYDQGAVYERDGQLYRAQPRIYQASLTRGSAGSDPSYSY